MIDPSHPILSVSRQCQLLDLSRSTYYYEPAAESPENLMLMRQIDEEYLRHPFLGSRRMTIYLRSLGYRVNRKRVQRLMRLMGLEGIAPGPRTSLPRKEHKIYPYLLHGLTITEPLQVWCSDLTYVPMPKGFMYLVAIMDWYSRYVLAWNVSNTMEASFCAEALESALAQDKPGIFNTDQGAQFTSEEFTGKLIDAQVRISMDGARQGA